VRDARNRAKVGAAALAAAAVLVACRTDSHKIPESEPGSPDPAHDLGRLGAGVQPARTMTLSHPDPRVLLRRPSVRGALSRSAAARVIRGNLQDIRFCYDRGLQRDPTLEGVVTIGFEIDENGRPSSVFVLGSTVADSTVDRCIARATSGWRFPSPRDGGEVKVTYPVLLEPG
jgi:TonB family protein